jgi:putative restriction endonuclease
MNCAPLPSKWLSLRKSRVVDKHMARQKWSRKELIIAFNLYCKTPFGRIHNRNPQIIELARAIGRSPSAVSWKLANFARLDPSLQQRSLSGALHGSKADIEVWQEFSNDWEGLAYESERLLTALTGHSVEEVSSNDNDLVLREGKDREAVVRVRINQTFFRNTVLAAHDYQCCITGLPIVELLNASHIIPWSEDKVNRVNPRNGVCLNVLHDRAFDIGLITILPDFTVRVASRVKNSSSQDEAMQLLQRFDGSKIRLPSRFLPEKAFLVYHNSEVFADGVK